MGRFRAQAERFGTRIVDVDVDRVDLSGRPFRVWARGVEYRGRGAHHRHRRLGAVARPRERDSGCAAAACRACATCDGFFFRDREIAVVGGGDTAMEEANYLTRFATQGPPAPPARRLPGQSKIMIDRAYGNPKIEVHTNTAIDEVLGDAKVEGLRLRDTRDRRASASCPIEGLFIAIGHKPNTDVFRDWLDVDEKGYLVVRDEHTVSRIEGVFIAGDVHDHRYRQAITAAGDGCTGGDRRRALARGEAAVAAARPRQRWPARRRAPVTQATAAAADPSLRGSGAGTGRGGGGRPPDAARDDFARVPRSGAAGRSAGSPPSSGRTGPRSWSCWSRSSRPACIGLVNPLLLKLLIDDVIVGRQLRPAEPVRRADDRRSRSCPG